LCRSSLATIRPHPTSTLLPYTTLFRSERAVKDLGLAGAKFHPGVQAFYPNDPSFYPLMEKIQELEIPALFHTGTNGLGAGTPGGDRKSTRLNSSHVAISYAVFCLKKKK